VTKLAKFGCAKTKSLTTCLQIIYPAMKTNQDQIEQIFTSTVESLLTFETTCSKAYVKLSKAAFAPELAKALDPGQTNIKRHIQRLKLIKKLFMIKSDGVLPTLSINGPKLSRMKTAIQDLMIMQYALQLQDLKISQYHFLLTLSISIQQEHAIALVEQCINENNDTNTWIKRTLNYTATGMLK